jgi:hypothetical protein
MPSTPTSNALPAHYPPTDDAAVRDAQVKLKMISAALAAQNIPPGKYTLQPGSIIEVNAQGQLLSITDP